MTTAFRLLALLLVSARAFAAGDTIDEATVLAKSLRIVDRHAACYLVYGASEFALAPKPPCYFLRSSDHGPQYFPYSDVGVDAVLIVAGTPVSDALRREWGLSPDLVCGTASQGVLIKGTEVTVSAAVLEGGVLCKDIGSDEKNFWYFAHTSQK
jgi:hypothetical protein